MGLTCGENIKVGGSIQHTAWENSPGNYIHDGHVSALSKSGVPSFCGAARW